MKTTNIKGKEYVEVKERLKYFRANFPEYSLLSEIVERSEKEVIIVAKVINPSGVTVATGTAHEVAGSSNINRGSHVENCETSAWGRALGNLGIGIDKSVASADEMLNKERIESERDKITEEQAARVKELCESSEVIADAIKSKPYTIENMPAANYNSFIKWAESQCTK